MAYGRLQAIGEAVTLKKNFGAGYKISIFVEPSKSDRIKHMVEAVLENSTLEDDSAGAILYHFPDSSLSLVGELVEQLKRNPHVKSWGISQTTLEQVFLSVIRSAIPDESNSNK
jgi:hypothetical protein